MGMVEDSPLRNPKKIPYRAPSPPVQSQVGPTNKEDTPNMKELVCVISTHVEMIDLEVTNNLNTIEDVQAQPPPADQPTEDAPERQAEDAVQLPPTDPLV